MSLALKTAPTEKPVTLEEAKRQLNVGHSRDDDLINALIDAVTEALDGKNGTLGRAIVSQEWVWTLDDFPRGDRELRVPLPPLASVEKIDYRDMDAAPQTVDAEVYAVDADALPGRISLAYNKSWPDDVLPQRDSVMVYFTAGWPDADAVPAGLKQGILVEIADLYQHRGSIVTGKTVNFTKAAERLLKPFMFKNITPAGAAEGKTGPGWYDPYRRAGVPR